MKSFYSAFISAVLWLSVCCAAEGASMDVRPGFAILPVVQGVTQEIELELRGTGGGDFYEVIVTAESGMGVLLTDSSPAPSGVVRCREGEPLRIAYRWAGPLPTEFPVREVITADAPALGLSARASFDVGINLGIRSVTVPGGVLSGAFAPVRVEIEDSFHPDADIASVLSELGIKPDIRLDLAAAGDGQSSPPAADDPVVAKFLGGTPASSDRPYSMPGFTSGRLVGGRDGGAVWEGGDGAEPGVYARSPGDYAVVVTLRSNAGGIGLKEMQSAPFTVSAPPGEARGAPGIVLSTGEILRSLGGEYRQSADPQEAMSSLGEALRRLAAPTPVQMLGRYVQALTASEEKLDDVLRLLPPFLGGYGGYGALIVTRTGVTSWSASSLDGMPYKNAPAGRVYEDEKYIVIPFELGKNFDINIQGSGDGEVSLWKVIPDGVNFKKYAPGDWERVITVHGDALSPDPPSP